MDFKNKRSLLCRFYLCMQSNIIHYWNNASKSGKDWRRDDTEVEEDEDEDEEKGEGREEEMRREIIRN